MKRILSFILTLVLALSVFTACDVPQSDDLMDDIKPNPDVAKNVELVDVSDAAVTDFGVRLFKESLADGENTLISPLSVLVALSMTANGADNETLTQMEAVLGMPIEQLNSWVKRYMANLPEEEKYKLSLANSIWFKDAESFTVHKHCNHLLRTQSVQLQNVF